jgi:hypothetical protein
MRGTAVKLKKSAAKFSWQPWFVCRAFSAEVSAGSRVWMTEKSRRCDALHRNCDDKQVSSVRDLSDGHRIGEINEGCDAVNSDAIEKQARSAASTMWKFLAARGEGEYAKLK